MNQPETIIIIPSHNYSFTQSLLTISYKSPKKQEREEERNRAA